MRYFAPALLFALLLCVGCEGPVGPQGPAGPTGATGSPGETGPQGEPGAFTYSEAVTGQTDADGFGGAEFAGRSLTDTVIACWAQTDAGAWVQLAFDSVNPGGGRGANLLPKHFCSALEVGGGLEIVVATTAETPFLVVAFGI